jgi:histidyl-tRNA synthetase
MRDLLPDEMERFRAIEAAFVETCRAWGYSEIRTPVIEPLHLFTAAGTLSPQTLERVYSFLDWDGWSGERVVLRPDSTIPAARLYAEALGGGTAKLFYVQDVFRFTDDGSPRDEWQCGVELIGDTGRTGDVEIVLLALDALAPLRLGPVRVRLSHVGVVRALLAAAGMSPEDQTVAYDRLLDGDVTVVDEIESRLPQLKAPLRLLFEVDGAGSGYIANVRGAFADAVPAILEPLGDLAIVVAALEGRGIEPIIQTVLTRNFEYYSGMVVKLDVADHRAVIGGRYDGLVELVGGERVPACGFGVYVAPLMDMLGVTAAANMPRVLVDAPGPDAGILSDSFAAAAALRAAGIQSETTRGTASDPTHRLILQAEAPRFRLLSKDSDQAFDTMDDVLRALGAGS